MTSSVEVAILGAGFGGLAVAHGLSSAGIDDFAIFERDAGVGGTWRANTYPGAACDMPSHLYSLSFAPNPDWSRAYATQPEILRYVEDCYDRFDVRRKVRCNTEIVEARWIENIHRWLLRDRDGNELLRRRLGVRDRHVPHAVDTRDPGPATTSAARRSIPPAGTTTTTSPVVGWQ